MIHPASLSETVDAVNEAAFYKSPVPATKRRATAAFLAGRHDVPGTYGRLFGLFPQEQAVGIRLFTGETLLALVEITSGEAGRELCYAAAKCEAAIRRNGSGKYSSRRRELARRVLERL